jgi:hypothetical protein
MSEAKRMEIAKEYVDRQLQTMKERDAVKTISKNEYDSLVKQVAKTVKT